MNPLYYVKCIMYSSFGFSKCALKGQQRLAQGVASLALVLGAFGLSARALSAASQQFKQA